MKRWLTVQIVKNHHYWDHKAGVIAPCTEKQKASQFAIKVIDGEVADFLEASSCACAFTINVWCLKLGWDVDEEKWIPAFKFHVFKNFDYEEEEDQYNPVLFN